MRRRRRLAYALGAVVAAAAALMTTIQPAQAATTPLPIHWSWTDGYIPNLPNSATPPPGANDWNCRSTGNKLPLILVHGTWEQQASNWQAMSPFFKNAGFCVYTFNYGGNPGDVMWGWKSIAASAGELSTFVEQVRTRTGSSQVDVVGHSQGGLMPRYYIKFLGGQGKIRNFVSMAASNHGTTLSGLADLGAALGINPALATIQPAAIDQTVGSPFMKKLNTCPDGVDADICPGDPTKYTVIETNGDQVVTPYTNAFLKGATNIEVNKSCPLELAEHLGMSYSRNVAQLALKALDPTVTKNVCIVSLPYIGGGN